MVRWGYKEAINFVLGEKVSEVLRGDSHDDFEGSVENGQVQRQRGI